MKALVVGGTGPTGPYLVQGLMARGYEVSIFHRGTHEIPEIPAEVEHIHGDPHFMETIEASLAGRTFDIAVVTYGRIRYLAQALVGKVGRFVSIGGVASYRGYMRPQDLAPAGMPIPVPEDAPLVTSEDEHRFSYLIAQTEQAVLEHHPEAAHFRYPHVYGPRQLVPKEWSFIRRALDGRKQLILPDGGLSLATHGYVENLAQAVLLAVDKPRESSGQIYNCGDETQLTLRQIAAVIAEKLDHEFDFVNMPHELALPARPYATGGTTDHKLMDLSKIKDQLGYRDVHPVHQALGLAVDWLLENRPEPGGDIEERLQDPFDYAGEDRVIAAWRECADQVAAVPFEMASHRPHPYAHPKKPGERDHRNR